MFWTGAAPPPMPTWSLPRWSSSRCSRTKASRFPWIEARGPMGLRKDLHIKALTEVPEIRERWKAVHGKLSGPGRRRPHVRRFRTAAARLSARVHSTLLPGVAETTQRLQKEYGIKIGSSTGFVRSMVDILEEDAKKQGLHARRLGRRRRRSPRCPAQALHGLSQPGHDGCASHPVRREGRRYHLGHRRGPGSRVLGRRYRPLQQLHERQFARRGREPARRGDAGDAWP